MTLSRSLLDCLVRSVGTIKPELFPFEGGVPSKKEKVGKTSSEGGFSQTLVPFKCVSERITDSHKNQQTD